MGVWHGQYSHMLTHTLTCMHTCKDIFTHTDTESGRERNIWTIQNILWMSTSCTKIRLTHTHTPTHTQLQSDTHRACIRLFSGNWSLQTHPLPSTTYKKRLTYINTFTCQRSVSAVKPNHMNSTFCEWGQRMALYGKPLSYDHGKRSRETIDTHTHTHT